MKENILLKKQIELQEQTNEVLQKLDLIKILSKYGEVKMVGSFSLGLMTWPDIDIDLISKTEINDQDYFSIINSLFCQKNIKQLILIDNRDSSEKNRPKSMYIGIMYNFNNIVWKIDIRYLNSSDVRTENDLKQIKEKLTEDKINFILEIKTFFHDRPGYGKEINGWVIYEAVLNNNVSTVKEFMEYLNLREYKTI